MEFKQITDLAVLPPEIEFNFEELKSELETGLGKYQGLVVTKDGIKDAKADRAKLNTLFKAIDDKRKEIKKECMKPYNAFEKKAKILLEMISSTSGAIDTQIKAFDEQRREEKRSEIEEFFTENVGDLKDLLPLDRIWNDGWLNATTKIKTIQEEIEKQIERVSADLAVIDGLHSEFKLQCKDYYLRTLDLAEAIKEVKRLEDNKKRLEEYAAKVDVPAEEPQQEIAQEEVPPAEPIQETEEQTKTIKVVFYDTTQAFRHDMKALTEKHGIMYGGIK